MPIYELKCQSCHQIEEHLLKFSDPKPTTCQSCGGNLTQLISQTSFALKGSGWYVTDYKSGSKASEPTCPAPAEQKASCAAEGGPCAAAAPEAAKA